MDFPGRLIAGLMGIILILLFPLPYLAHVQSEDVDYLINEKTRELSDSIRDKGYIDTQMYESYISILDVTREHYDISLEHIHPVYGEELGKEQLIGNPFVLNTKYSKLLNKSTLNHSHSLNQFLNLSSTSHVHTKDCYEDHRHDETCGGFSLSASLVSSYFYSNGSNRYFSLKCASCKQLILYMDNVSSSSDTYVRIIANGVTNKYYFNGDATEYFQANNYFTYMYNLLLEYKINENLKDYSGEYINSYYCYIPPKDINFEIPYVGTLEHCPFNCGYSSVNDYLLSASQGGPIYNVYIRCEFCNETIISCQLDYINNYCYIYFNYKDRTVRITDFSTVYEFVTLVKKHYPSDSVFLNINKDNPVLQLDYIKEGLEHGCVNVGLWCNIEEDTEPICDKVKSVDIDTIEINVPKYTPSSELPITITITYINETVKTITSGFEVIGYNPKIVGKQEVLIQYSIGGVTYSSMVIVNVRPLTKICSTCLNEYELDSNDMDPGCSYCIKSVIGIEINPEFVEVTQGEALPIVVNTIYQDGKKVVITGWTSNYDPERIGYQFVLVEYGGYGVYVDVWVNERMQQCPICETMYPVSETQCPVCLNKLIGITLSSNEITVRQYQPINISVTAYYVDGTFQEVYDWIIDRDTYEIGTFLATISYGGFTAELTVHVQSEWIIECHICGTIYEPFLYPKGCPICSETMIGIEAYLSSDSPKVQLGTYPNIIVVAVFQDEHRLLVSEGFTIDNFHSNKEGMQNILIKYQGLETNLLIEVVNNMNFMICENGHMFYYDMDDLDPICPYCFVSESNKVIYYYEIVYWNDIIDAIYEKGRYDFKEDTYLTLLVRKKEISLLSKIQRMFFKTSLLGRRIYFMAGGEIKKR